MSSLSEWLKMYGPSLAVAVDARRDAICERVTSRMMHTFPKLCFLPQRFDAAAFQRRMFIETPLRFHRLIQVILNFQTLRVIEREYSWGWRVLQRYGVHRQHLTAQVTWYFDACAEFVAFNERDLQGVQVLGNEIMQIVEQITRIPPVVLQHALAHSVSNGHSLN